VDNNVIGALIVAAIIALAFWGMYRSWKRRTQESALTAASNLGGSVTDTDTDTDTDTAVFTVFYVATTPTESPLQRLNLPGLAFRAKARILIFAHHIEIAPAGETPTVISATSFLGVRRARVAIDRVVEKDGLTAIDWVATNSSTGQRSLVTSFLRVPNIRARDSLEKTLEAFGATHTETVKEVAS
jgi:hypothetical protein